MNTTGPADKKQPNQPTDGHIKQLVSRNWYLLAGVAIVNSLAMVVTVSPLLTGRFAEVWPWANTERVLLVGFAVLVVLLVVYLTAQQRKFVGVRGEVNQMEVDSRTREQQHKERLKALLNISRMMGSVPNIEKSFQYFTDTTLELFDGQQASLMLVDEEKQQLEVRAATGHLREDEVKVATMKIGEGVSGWVAQNQRPLLLGPGIDLSQYPGLNVSTLDMTAAMIVPVTLRDELVGILSVRSRTPEIVYGEEDLQALQVFAENIGTVIHHSEHVEWMRKTLEKYRSEHSESFSQ